MIEMRIESMAMGGSGWLTSVAYSPDGSHLATGCNDSIIRIWDASLRRCRHVLAGHADIVYRVAYSSTGDRLASASGDGTVRVWEMVSGRCVRAIEAHAGGVSGVSFSFDGKYLATAGAKGDVSTWDTSSWARVETIACKQEWIDVSCAPTADFLMLAGSHGKVIVREILGRTIHAFDAHDVPVLTTCWSPDGGIVAAGGLNGISLLWKFPKGDLMRVLVGHGGPIRSLHYNSTGDVLASASEDGTVRLWTSVSGETLGVLRTSSRDAVRGVCFSPQGRPSLATVGHDSIVRLWV